MSDMRPKVPQNQAELRDLQRENNPESKPVGDYTGRCRICHSDNLWDDNLAYGCNSCGAFLKFN